MKVADAISLASRLYIADHVVDAPGVLQFLATKLIISLLAGTGAAKTRSTVITDVTDVEASYIDKAASNVVSRSN